MKTEVNSQAELMRRYLLGKLPESEQIALEHRFFDDGELLEQMQIVEQELVDTYVRGRLGDREREAFERHYLNTPRQLERVAFAQELLRLADEAPVTTPEERPVRQRASFRPKFLAFLRTPQFVFSVAIAMAVILFVGGAWLIAERAQWRQQRAKLQSDRGLQEQRTRALEDLITQQSEQNAQLSAELERLREELRQGTAPASESTLLSVALLPTSRGGNRQQTIRLLPGIKQVRMQMNIGRGAYQRYQVNLRQVDGGEVWQTRAVRAVPGKDSVAVSVNTPVTKLSRGDYILTLSGIDAGGSAEQIELYSFRVTHQNRVR